MLKEEHIRTVVQEVQTQLDELYQRSDNPEPGSALNQVGLRDGAYIVEDYLRQVEAGLAFEHVLYMILEPDLPLSATAFRSLKQAGEQLKMSPRLWADVRQEDD